MYGKKGDLLFVWILLVYHLTGPDYMDYIVWCLRKAGKLNYSLIGPDYVQYIPNIVHTVQVLLCFVMLQ